MLNGQQKRATRTVHKLDVVQKSGHHNANAMHHFVNESMSTTTDDTRARSTDTYTDRFWKATGMRKRDLAIKVRSTCSLLAHGAKLG